MKYFIVAGEKSGDLHAGNLAQAILKQQPSAELFGWGGSKMQNAGVKILQDYKELAFMGFVEVLKNLGKIRGFMAEAKRQIAEIQPDTLILVDYAGFNLRLAKWAKERRIRVVYYIAPKAWAWNEKRVHQLRKYTDLCLVIFPFEVEFFNKYGVNAYYVGNPLFDEIRSFQPDQEWKQDIEKEGKDIIALLPGSRKQEIEAMLKVMAGLSEKHPDFKWVVAGVEGFSEEFYRSHGGTFTLLYDKTYDLLSVAKAAVVTSGTATLETALFNVPQVVVYRTSPITYTIAKLLVKIKYISLVNLVANEGVVRELIQHEYNIRTTENYLIPLLGDNKTRAKQLIAYETLINKFGNHKASEEAAKLIIQ